MLDLNKAKALEIRVAGFGGQGIIRCGYIIGRAATLYGSKSAAQSQAYGPESRGGACSTGVIIKDGFVDYPLVRHPKVMIIMSQEAYNTFHLQLAKGGIIIADKDLVEPAEGDQPVILVPATRMAEHLGRKVVANIILLGVFSAVTGFIDEQAIRKSISDSVPPGTVDVNIKAFDLGLEYVRECGIEWEEAGGTIKQDRKKDKEKKKPGTAGKAVSKTAAVRPKRKRVVPQKTGDKKKKQAETGDKKTEKGSYE
ncbi:MAG: 2-oxoacid:acceptor oxidoreductase family protein [Chloroflexi bacterium]|nr:2-oxoacid:acceptor oxidoreductase family protein [Chloroflexota bacterium]